MNLGDAVKPKRRSRSTVAKRTRRSIKLVPADSPEARDEGPRLIPLSKEHTDSKVKYYLRLANRALGIPDEK